MAEPYVGEIRLFGGNYAPEGWSLCDGTELAIAGNEPLFSLIGTTYGGDGITTFRLPDLRGRVPLHVAVDLPLGAVGGSEQVTLTANGMPAHTHKALATSAAGTETSPANAVWAKTGSVNYTDNSANQPLVPMNQQLLGLAGNGLPHDNMMPTLTITFIIARVGIYPNEG